MVIYYSPFQVKFKMPFDAFYSKMMPTWFGIIAGIWFRAKKTATRNKKHLYF
jgi:hypothetical protein